MGIKMRVVICLALLVAVLAVTIDARACTCGTRGLGRRTRNRPTNNNRGFVNRQKEQPRKTRKTRDETPPPKVEKETPPPATDECDEPEINISVNENSSERSTKNEESNTNISISITECDEEEEEEVVEDCPPCTGVTTTIVEPTV